MELTLTKRTDPRLLSCMSVHYSNPKGFVGRNLCYAITFDSVYYGHIVGGSATRFLPGRNEFLGVELKDINKVINNIFFHIEKVDGQYPVRNFGQKILKLWRQTVINDWESRYGDNVVGLESLVELPRTGEVYLRDGWKLTGQTVGYTCKRIAGVGTDKWSGKRVWDTENLRPKHVFCIKT
jgi:hypothetical protein